MKINEKRKKLYKTSRSDDVIDDKSVQKILEIGKKLISITEIDEILKLAIDQLLELSNAERGLIILFNKNEQPLIETARNLKKEDINNPVFEVSNTIINKVKNGGSKICLKNALEEPQLSQSASTARLKILSVICLPLSFDSKIFGVIYLDNRTALGVFNENIYRFVQEFADFISLAAYNALERKTIQNKVIDLENKLHGKYVFDSIITNDSQMIKILDDVAQIAETDATVLIQGESGTGKELIAKALHYNSLRREKPFIPINCAAIPENLLESELFGYTKGAFTGAVSDKKGKFSQANGGTIFFDEISEMSATLQTKLLRVLQNGEYSPLGSSIIKYCDVRFLAATNKNLKKLVEQNKFREDVYYRLNIIDIFLPPLRERESDVIILTNHFLETIGKKYGKVDIEISKQVETLLRQYAFPGNVRELENIIHHAVILCKEKVVQPNHLPKKTFNEFSSNNIYKISKDFKAEKQKVIEQFEREFLVECLKETKGNISQAARLAEIQYVSFYNKIKKYGIEPYKYK